MATATKKHKVRKDKILAAVVTFPVWEAAVEAAEKDGRTKYDSRTIGQIKWDKATKGAE